MLSSMTRTVMFLWKRPCARRYAGTSGTKFPSTLGPGPRWGGLRAVMMSLLAFMSVSVDAALMQSRPFPVPMGRELLIQREVRGGRNSGETNIRQRLQTHCTLPASPRGRPG